MKRKLIALVEVLMVVSLLCTGYGSWAITPPDTSTQGGTIQTYEVSVRKPETYGLSLSDEGAKSFTFCTVTAGGDPTTQYTNKMLAISLKLNRSTLTSWAANDYRGENLVISCMTNDNGTYAYAAYYVFRNYMVPKDVKLTLVGYPNLYLNAQITQASSYEFPLKITIPLEQIYNLAVLDKANATTSTMLLTLECEESDGTTSDDRSSICALTYTFTAGIEKAAST